MKRLALALLISALSCQWEAFAVTPTPTPSPTPATVGRNFTVDIVDGQTVDGYKLKWGATSGSYPTVIDLGNNKTHDFADFPIGTVYMVATCYSNAGGESKPTAELKITVVAAPDAP